MAYCLILLVHRVSTHYHSTQIALFLVQRLHTHCYLLVTPSLLCTNSRPIATCCKLPLPLVHRLSTLCCSSHNLQDIALPEMLRHRYLEVNKCPHLYR